MEFGVLGTVEVRAHRERVPLAPKPRMLLAVLLCHANERVAQEQLVDALWGAHPPDSAAGSVRIYVSQMRRAWRDPARISSERGGYRLSVHPRELDAHRFDELVQQARGTGDPATAGSLLRAALSLWRGRAFADVDHRGSVTAAAVRLDELRSAAIEERVTAELALGRHADLLAELTVLASEHPLRERLRGLLMLALYRAGRQGEALAVFERTRARLRAELGVDPGPDLRRLHLAMLRGDDHLVAVGNPVVPLAVPRELPADVQGFRGRDDALKVLDEWLPDVRRDSAAGPVVISAIAGTAGVGKTALAVHWAHRVADQFPDGQLYVNLRGYDREAPVRPLDALAGFLRALGLPTEQVPADPAEAAARFRSLVAGRRMLVVLDNAGSVEQTRPLLPGSPGCLVLVTSRDKLSGLVARDGARRLTLDVLTPGQADDLLRRLLGANRVDEQPAAAVLAQECGYLPLALRIAAAYLDDRPHVQIADYVAALQAGDPIAALSINGDSGSAVRAAFDLSYRTLTPPAQRLFRLFGLVPCDDFDTAAAAALAALAEPEITQVVDELADAHLVEWHGSGRFCVHDLLRRYATTLADSHDTAPDRDEAMRRLFRWTRSTTTATLPYPGYRGCPRSTTCRRWVSAPGEADAGAGVVAGRQAQRDAEGEQAGAEVFGS